MVAPKISLTNSGTEIANDRLVYEEPVCPETRFGTIVRGPAKTGPF